MNYELFAMRRKTMDHRLLTKNYELPTTNSEPKNCGLKTSQRPKAKSQQLSGTPNSEPKNYGPGTVDYGLKN